MHLKLSLLLFEAFPSMWSTINTNGFPLCSGLQPHIAHIPSCSLRISSLNIEGVALPLKLAYIFVYVDILTSRRCCNIYFCWESPSHNLSTIS